jgi:dihydrofolate reductase
MLDVPRGGAMARPFTNHFKVLNKSRRADCTARESVSESGSSVGGPPLRKERARMGHPARYMAYVDTIAYRLEESMSKVRVAAFSVSLDGFGAGPRQDLQNPLGVRGLELHGWFFTTDVFQKIHGQGEGTKGIDNDVAEQSFANVGAWILGRNMFGPVRGPWNDKPGESWKGWWGDNPPYHTPVFVLTHHPRPALAMEGGTTFYFVTDGAELALNKAREAAQGKDVRIGGGVSTIRQYLTAGQIDEMHLAMSPVLLGEGELLFSGINLSKLGFVPYKTLAGENATHVFVRNQKKTL